MLINLLILVIFFLFIFYTLFRNKGYYKYMRYVLMCLMSILVFTFTQILRDVNLLNENIYKIKDIKLKSDFRKIYNKRYSLGKFSYIGKVDENFLKMVLTQRAKEEGYIIGILPEMKNAVILQEPTLSLGIISEIAKIEKENGRVTIWTNGDSYYLQFYYQYEIEVYKKVTI